MKYLLFLLAKLFSRLIIMLRVAFITLLERKYLGLTQDRLGVNKVSLSGVFQPLLDAVKLLAKELSLPLKRAEVWYFLAPLSLLVLSLLLWDLFSATNGASSLGTLLLLLVLLSLKVVSSLLVGWVRGRKYSTVGALRVTAVRISFEVCFALIIYCLQIWVFSLALCSSSLILALRLLPFWVFIVLCDTMRTPFDLGEAESELVRGINTEHMSSTFVLLFLAEYTTIIFLRILTSLLFFSNRWSASLFVFSFILMSRATYARVKNDILMRIIWWSVLPGVLYLLFCLL